MASELRIFKQVIPIYSALPGPRLGEMSKGRSLGSRSIQPGTGKERGGHDIAEDCIGVDSKMPGPRGTAENRLGQGSQDEAGAPALLFTSWMTMG